MPDEDDMMPANARKIIIGSAGMSSPGWLATDIDSLNVVDRDSFLRLAEPGSIDVFLAEHVWEHLTPDEALLAARNCYEFLRPGGRLRIAVPDGYHPSPAYREHVRPGGIGAGAEDHKLLYNYQSLKQLLEKPGFEVKLLEYWDEGGTFHVTQWSSEDGHIARSSRYDPRNQDGSLTFTSLIIDAVRPLSAPRLPSGKMNNHMRLMRITTNYPAYLKQFYSRHTHMADQPYSVQYRALMDDCFGWSDFWTEALRPLGYEVWEPVGNAEPQQKAWAREYGVRYGDREWVTEIIAAQAKHFRPDVLFVNDHYVYKRWFLDSLRKAVPSIRLMIGWCGAPYADADVFNAYDLVLSNIASFVDRFREDGHRSEQMCHGFAPTILNRIQKASDRRIPFSFAGSIVKNKLFHNERESLLRHLIRNSSLKIWSDVEAPPLEEYRRLLRLKAKYAALRRLGRIPGGSLLAKALPQYRGMHRNAEPDLSNCVDFEIVERAKPGVYGLAMYQLLHDSQVTFNNHIDASAQFANNLRLYEATGVGTCLLTDWKENLCTLFEPDQEVVTYRCADEAIEKVQYLLTHDDERRRIGEAGQRRTLRDHSLDVRAEQLHQIIERLREEVSLGRERRRPGRIRFSELPAGNPLLWVHPSLKDRVGLGPTLNLPQWGIEQRKPARPFVWLGRGKEDGLHTTIWADSNLEVLLSAEVVAGPARPDDRRTLRFTLTNDSGEQVASQTFEGRKTVLTRLKLAAGANHLDLEVLDTPTAHPRNDLRPLLVKLLGLEIADFDPSQLGPPGRPLIRLSPSLCSKAELDPTVKTPGWPIESDEAQSWLWLGSGEDQGFAVGVRASEAAEVTFELDVRPGPARTDADRTLELRVENDTGRVTQIQKISGTSRIAFKGALRKGPNTFQLLVHEPATCIVPGDNRPLLACVSGATLGEEPVEESSSAV